MPTLVIRDVDQLIEWLDGSRLTFAGLQGAKNFEAGGDRGLQWSISLGMLGMVVARHRCWRRYHKLQCESI